MNKSYIFIFSMAVFTFCTSNAQSDKQLDSTLFFRYNNFTKNFDSLHYESYVFDGQGKVKVNTMKTPSGTILSRTLFFYDVSGNVLKKNVEVYDPATSEYSPYLRYDYLYDDKENLLSEKTAQYNQSSSQYVLKRGDSTRIIYDSEGRYKTMLTLVYDEANILWIPQTKTEYEYNGAEPLPVLRSFYRWGNSNWSLYYRIDNIYWGFGFEKITTEPSAYRSYSMVFGQLEPSGYDSSVIVNDRVTERHEYAWDGGNDYTFWRIDSLTYDTEGHLFSDLKYTREGELSFGNKDSVIYEEGRKLESFQSMYRPISGPQHSEWVFTTKEQHYYSKKGLWSKVSVPAPGIFIYPNPAQHGFSIQKDDNEQTEVLVYSMEGKKILRLTLSDASTHITTAGWKKGIYLVKLQSTAGISTHRVQIIP